MSEPAAARRVAVGLGSNRCHGRHGRPAAVVRAAAAALAAGGIGAVHLSAVIATPPIGPSRRMFANAVLVGTWAGSADALLSLLQQVETGFGRRRARRWGERVIDCDLLLIERETVRTPRLRVPHPALAERDFVLRPLLALWPEWRHPETGLRVRQMRYRLVKRRPAAQAATRPGAGCGRGRLPLKTRRSSGTRRMTSPCHSSSSGTPRRTTAANVR
jgi:2-amino-4-hydroxy-6-hydroxymethyldihydropteridine diphosphokinase